MKRIFSLMLNATILTTNPLFAMEEEFSQDSLQKYTVGGLCNKYYDLKHELSSTQGFLKTTKQAMEEISQPGYYDGGGHIPSRETLTRLKISTPEEFITRNRQAYRETISETEQRISKMENNLEKLETYIATVSGAPEDKLPWAIVQYDRLGHWYVDGFFGTKCCNQDPAY